MAKDSQGFQYISKSEQRITELEQQLAKYEETALANGRLQAENARLKSALKDITEISSTQSHVTLAGYRYLIAEIAARAEKEQDNG